MRILYFSDIHLETREYQVAGDWTALSPLVLGPRLNDIPGQIDLVILAGDIGKGDPAKPLSALTYAQQLHDYIGAPVVFVPGNHEYYYGDFDQIRTAMLAAHIPGVTVLDRGEARFSFATGALRVLGATLWTDYALMDHPERAMIEASLRMNDHRLIRYQGGVFKPQHALAEHQLSRLWLADQLREPAPSSTLPCPTLIVTHHVPHSSARHPLYALDHLSPAFYSDCDDLITAAGEANVAGWIFGHHHWCQDFEVGGVRLLSAQWGYPSENTDWAGPQILEIVG